MGRSPAVLGWLGKVLTRRNRRDARAIVVYGSCWAPLAPPPAPCGWFPDLLGLPPTPLLVPSPLPSVRDRRSRLSSYLTLSSLCFLFLEQSRTCRIYLVCDRATRKAQPGYWCNHTGLVICPYAIIICIMFDEA
ncbi:hypothetical protein NDU88_004046 [Pleurodeles waltl]|uniref:Uncharacterized protein n=1 Tax=Pleurodeles waltl TaxID=8319 RepID=A0AAV7W5H4_PLEWA|nr:hypothetical protein NDU88_004046 [Pleurodeles waltl]